MNRSMEITQVLFIAVCLSLVLMCGSMQTDEQTPRQIATGLTVLQDVIKNVSNSAFGEPDVNSNLTLLLESLVALDKQRENLTNSNSTNDHDTNIILSVLDEIYNNSCQYLRELLLGKLEKLEFECTPMYFKTVQSLLKVWHNLIDVKNELLKYAPKDSNKARCTGCKYWKNKINTTQVPEDEIPPEYVELNCNHFCQEN